MKSLVSFLLFALGLGALFGVVWWLRVREPEAAPERGRPPFVLPVTLGKVRLGRISPIVLITGNVRSADNASLGFEVAGRLTEVLADDASVVQRGEVLARLDDRDAQVALARAVASHTLAQKELELLLAGARDETKRRLAAELEAEDSALELAQRELDRGRELATDRIISSSQLDVLDTTLRAAKSRLGAKQEELKEAEAGSRLEDVEVARAQLGVRAAEVTEAELALQKTVLSAPFDGVVTRRLVSVGDPVAARESLFELVDLAHREITAEIPARYAAQLKIGAGIEVSADDLPDFRLETELDALVPVADSASGNVRGIARLSATEDSAGLLAPGFFVRLRLELNPLEQVLIVPADALRVTGTGTIVVRAAPALESAAESASAAAPDSKEAAPDSKEAAPAPLVAEWIPVRKLAADGSGIAIVALDETAPLSAGDQVVISGVDRAFPGAPLLIREESVRGATQP